MRFLNILKFVAPFIAIYILVGLLPPLFARLAGEPFIVYNQPLEGARVGNERNDFLRGKFPKNYDIFFAGTSRTMSDFSASTVASVIKKRANLTRMPKAYNLGNVANNLDYFEKTLVKSSEPRVLILEYHPLRFIHEDPPPQNDFYSEYRAKIVIGEDYVSGYARKATGLENRVTFGFITLSAMERMVEKRMTLKEAFYFHQTQLAYGTSLQPDGQVYFRTFLPDKKAGEILSKIIFNPDDERSLLQGHIEKSQWNALDRILERFSGGGRSRVIFVRAPVSPVFYKLENEFQGELTKKFIKHLADKNVPYIDLNPCDCFLSDGSHVDWYETKKLSGDLADRIAPFVIPLLDNNNK